MAMAPGNLTNSDTFPLNSLIFCVCVSISFYNFYLTIGKKPSIFGLRSGMLLGCILQSFAEKGPLISPCCSTPHGSDFYCITWCICVYIAAAIGSITPSGETT